MVSLARATLRHDWRGFLPAILSVAFSGVLILVQLSLLLGMFGTTTTLVDRSGAQLWIGSNNTPSFDQARDIPLRTVALVWSNPAVTAVQTLLVRAADWRAADGTRVGISLVGFTPRADGLVLPAAISAAQRAALLTPNAVLADQADLAKLHVGAGQSGEIAGHRVRVAGVLHGFRNIGNPYVFASQATARRLTAASAEPASTTYILARLHAAADAAAVRATLAAGLRHPHYQVWTAHDLSLTTQRYWLTESGVGAGFAFSVLLGLVVGLVITSQTLRAAVIANLKEYATFRALGVPSAKLFRVVLEQAFWVGMLGAALTGLITLGAAWIARLYHVPMIFHGWEIGGTFAFVMFVALASGLAALRELYRLEPALLLR